MNGEDESYSANFVKLKGKAEVFENSIGLPPLNRGVATFEYLNITGVDIAKMGPDQCGQIATDLASYAIYIQRTLSKEISYLRWFENKINLAIAPDLSSYPGYYSTDQRRALAVGGNEYARTLEDLRITTQVKVDMLSQLPFQINQLIKTLLEAQSSKRYNRG